MRWYVDISSLGKGVATSDPGATRHCVERDQWQKALQEVRKRRNDGGDFGDLSIELLDDGYRAIDSSARLRFDVRKAPDDAPLTDTPTPLGSAVAPKESSPSRPRASSRRRAAASRAIPADPTPAQAEPTKAEPTKPAASKAQPGPAKPAASKAEPGLAKPAGSKAEPGLAKPAASKAEPAKAIVPNAPAAAVIHEAPAPALPESKVLSSRSDDPTASSPLTYREVALAVASTTSIDDAVALARAEFDKILASLRATPTGKFIQIAVFDHTFEAKPQRPPVVIVSFKDWRSSEPDLRFPLRDGPSARMSLAPHEGGALSMRPAPPPEPAAPESAPASSRKVPAPRPSQLKRDAADMVGEDEPTLLRPEPPKSEPPPAPKAKSEPPPAPEAKSEPPPAPKSTRKLELIPEPDADDAKSGTSKAASEPPPAPKAASEPPPAPKAASEPPPAPKAASEPPPAPKAPASKKGEAKPERAVKGAEAKGTEPKGVEAGGARIVRSAKRARKSGDDLLTDLFESCSELGFLPDAFAGADFAIDIALESIPCAVVLVSWFDINAREMVVVRQGLTSGEPEKLGNAVLARGSEKLPLIARAMRSGHAQLVSGAALDGIAKDPRWTAIGKPPSSLLVVPIRAGGRYLGLLEAADPLSGKPFGTADADAFTYLGQQLGEFFAEREPSLDPERITRPRLAAAAASRR